MGDAYADIPKSGGDFAKAISVCINSRQCETAEKGVMCPSFRVTHDSHLSTGGRVRMLKAALNGEFTDANLMQQDLADAMDLCVACKGCKRECENEVDMAMIKVEYLAQRYTKNKVPLRSKLLANIARQLHYLPALPSLITLRNRFPPLAKLGEILGGISATRQLPVPVKQTFLQSYQPQPYEQDTEFHDEVVLLIDTFTNHFAPDNAHAATEVLERAGYRVIPTLTEHTTDKDSRPLCCGRTHIAHGLVKQAKAEASRMLEALIPHVAAGRKVIGLEPACLLAIRDDYRFLGLGEAAEKVAANALLFEEFIAREITARRFTLAFKAVNTGNQPVLVHGHCHQKAVGAMKSVRKLLKLIPDLKYEFIEASCCGMAGSFGIEKEHAEISAQMAELSLLPALREQPEARVIANGFSCQHQMKEGANRSSVHIARLLQEALP